MEWNELMREDEKDDAPDLPCRREIEVKLNN
jgi:hypothetical protein